jgi:hypothetical protein
MKNTVSLLLILFLISCTAQNKQKNSLTEENLKGSVKSVREFSFDAVDKFGEISKGERKREKPIEEDYYRKYNDKGNQIETNYYKSDGSLRLKHTYKYDDKGNKIEWNAYYSNGRQSSKYTHKFDDKGNRIENNVYKSDGRLSSTYTYKYCKSSAKSGLIYTIS